MELYALIAISIAVGCVGWYIRGRKPQAVLKVRRGEVRIRGQLSSHQEQAIRQFLQSEFSNLNSLNVTIYPFSRDPKPRIVIRGNISESESQVIRNFLVSML